MREAWKLPCRGAKMKSSSWWKFRVNASRLVAVFWPEILALVESNALLHLSHKLAISLLFVKRTATVSNSPVIKLFIPSQSHLNHNGEAQILLQGKSHKNSFEEAHLKRCGCGCGRKLVGRKKYDDSSCRKRAQCVRDKRTASNAT